MNDVFLIKWYGPIPKEEVKEWEANSTDSFNLYLIYGKKKKCKKNLHYYVGEATKQTVGKRFKNANHHINDFSEIKEIWIGTIDNIEPEEREIRLIEKMLTSYLCYTDEVGEKSLLNQTNKYAPRNPVYLINRWFKSSNRTEWKRHKAGSPAMIIADVIAYKLDKNNQCVLFEAKRLKRKW